MEIKMKDLKAYEILDLINNGKIIVGNPYKETTVSEKGLTYIILGRGGPTGKTWLTTELKKSGFNAFEITPDIIDFVLYSDDKNHLIINGYDEMVIIILNMYIEGK